MEDSGFGDGRSISPERLRIPCPQTPGAAENESAQFRARPIFQMEISVSRQPAWPAVSTAAPLPSARVVAVVIALPRPSSVTARAPPSACPAAPSRAAPRATSARHSRGFAHFHAEFPPNSRFTLHFRAEGALTPSANTRHSRLKRQCPVPPTLGSSEGPAGPRPGPGSHRNALRACTLDQ